MEYGWNREEWLLLFSSSSPELEQTVRGWGILLTLQSEGQQGQWFSHFPMMVVVEDGVAIGQGPSSLLLLSAATPPSEPLLFLSPPCFSIFSHSERDEQGYNPQGLPLGGLFPDILRPPQ